MSTHSKQRKIIGWLLNGDVGASSKSIASMCIFGRCEEIRYPYDPADLRRCMELLEIEPDAISAIDALAQHSKHWALFRLEWEELSRTLEEEMSEGTGIAPRTYKMMQRILEEADRATGK